MRESERAHVHAVLGRVGADIHADGLAREELVRVGKMARGKDNCMHAGENKKQNKQLAGQGVGGCIIPWVYREVRY
jgi:hypothetical protein